MSISLNKSYLFLVILFSSCAGSSNLDNYEVGQCFKESRTDYASYAKQSESIYRIEEVLDDTFKVSIWYGKSWLYQGSKLGNYFKDRASLVYQETNCPGTKKKAAITDKIKGIELN